MWWVWWYGNVVLQGLMNLWEPSLWTAGHQDLFEMWVRCVGRESKVSSLFYTSGSLPDELDHRS